MNTFKIEKNIPVPPSTKTGAFYAALQEMEIGDSIVVKNYGQVSHFAKLVKKYGKGMVISRKLDGGARRVWLVEKR